MDNELQASNKEVLHKATAAIHIGSKFSFIERKLFNVLLWNAQEHRYSPGKEYNISNDLLLSFIKWDKSKNQTRLQEILDKFTTTSIVWNERGKDRTGEWGVCTFLQGGRIRGKTTYYRLNDYVVEKLLNPNVFAKIFLQVQTQFSSRYSLIIYEYFADVLSREKKTAHEEKIEIDLLNNMLDYSGLYKHLNNDILKKCKKEINRYTDISINYEGMKQGRKVVAVKFTAEKKSSFQPELPFDTASEFMADDDSPNLELLTKHGVTKRKAKALLDSYDINRIEENLKLVIDSIANGREIKNVAAYIVKAIEEDYRPKKTPAQIEEEQRKRWNAKYLEEYGEYETVKRQWELFRIQTIKERFSEKSAKWQEERRETFKNTLLNSPTENNYFVVRALKKDGMSSRIVETAFMDSLSDELLFKPHEKDLVAYIEYTTVEA